MCGAPLALRRALRFDRLHEYDHFDETDNPIYNTYIFEEKYLQTTTSAALFSHNEISLLREFTN